MNFQDFYKTGHPQFSFEIFPPKSATEEAALAATLQSLARFEPAFISVTYGAMGSTRDRTRDLALEIQRCPGLTTAFHFTCVGTDRENIRSYVEHLKKKGLNLIVALRGDPPDGLGSFVPPANGFAHANELVAFLQDLGGFSIAVAGYPEGHIESPDRETDLRYLKKKVDAGADIILTQLFFENAHYFDFVQRARAMGISIPIIPGIMPILSLRQIEKITRLCGASLPETLRRDLVQHEDDPSAIREIGIRHALSQCRELLARGVPGIHFYTLNKSASTTKIIEGLGTSQKKS